MAICIVVLSDSRKANQIKERLVKAATPLVKCDLIRPLLEDTSFVDESSNESVLETKDNLTALKPVDINTIELLNPRLAKQLRQKKIAYLLLPFGFIAGLSFTQMTGLTTFSDLGVGGLGEPLSGAIVGMVSGWMGSYVAAWSVNSKNEEDITTLRKLSEEGLWLLLLETPFETELPWQFLQEVDPLRVVRLLDQ